MWPRQPRFKSGIRQAVSIIHIFVIVSRDSTRVSIAFGDNGYGVSTDNSARLAQLAARRSHNPKVVGSIPTLCIHILIDNHCTIGAVGSALVLCTEGPGFEPLMVQYIYESIKKKI